MQYSGVTDIGRMRQTNQDSYTIASNEKGDVLAMVCDGIGGGKAGDIASTMVVNTLSEIFSQHSGFIDDRDVLEWIHITIQRVNEKVFSFSTTSNSYRGMGTTLVAILFCSIGKYIINIGDSRAYALYQHGEFRQLTVDHSLVNELINTGQITRQEALVHPQKNVLTNAIGIWATVKADVERFRENVKTFLLCSDGLHGYVNQMTIETIIKNNELSVIEKVRKLLQEALASGGYDNITIIVIEMERNDRP